MKVRLERTFPMPAPADRTWTVLSDIERVAPCMPGAKITERIDATHYKGTVGLKLGPANMTFRGEIEVKRLDPSTRTLELSAKGNDTTGASFATMDLTARVEATADGNSALVGTSEASVGGKAAAFGSRMMDAVSDQILKQFAANFAARVVEAEQAAAVTGAPATAALEATEHAVAAAAAASIASPGAVSDAAPSPMSAAAPATVSPAATAASAATTPPVAPTEFAAPAPQLNAAALLLAIVRDWFKGLFTRKA